MSNFISLEVGKRVWTEEGYRRHGPATGPKTDVPSKTGGSITRIDISNSGVVSGQALYTVDWDTGQQTHHYSHELICIGSFRTMDEFRALIRLGSAAQVTIGAQGGFRSASLVVPTNDGLLSIHVRKEHESIWASIIEPILKEGRIPIRTDHLERKKPTTKAQREDNQTSVTLALEKLRKLSANAK